MEFQKTGTEVFIHGLGQGPESWRETLENMHRGNDVFCPDLSQMLGEGTYAALYRSFSEACGQLPGPLRLYGLSLGGVLALHYGIEHPQNVHSLVLIAAQYTMPTGLLAFQSAVFRLLPERAFAGMGIGKREMLTLTASMAKLDFSRNLEKVSCPVLVVCGEKDRANRRAAEDLARRLPHARLYLCPGAGHEVNRDAPEALAAQLEHFYGENGTVRSCHTDPR